MESAAFRTWLDGVHRLDASQRGQAMRALALAEFGIPGDHDEASGGAAARRCNRT